MGGREKGKRKIFRRGFKKRSGEQFFARLQKAGVKRRVDVRLNNTSQLASFAKARDLEYFLKVIDVPMNYRFEIYRYGPFCSQIMRDADFLEFDNIIVDNKGDIGSSYQPSENIKEFLGEFEGQIGQFRNSVRNLAEILAPLSTKVLELYATVDFVYREQRAKNKAGPWKQTVLERFMTLKGERFNRDEVDSIYDNMCKAGIFEP